MVAQSSAPGVDWTRGGGKCREVDVTHGGGGDVEYREVNLARGGGGDVEPREVDLTRGCADVGSRENDLTRGGREVECRELNLTRGSVVECTRGRLDWWRQRRQVPHGRLDAL